MKKYIMALDAGTTSNRAILFDKGGNIVSVSQKEFPLYTPKIGFIEQNPEELFQTMLWVMEDVIKKSGIDKSEIDSIGITNQRETTILWDKETGLPIYNAIVWQCRRTADYCEILKKENKETLITEKTGLKIDPYFSGTKIRWILKEVPGAYEKAKMGKILFGTVDTWLLYRLTGGKSHKTDYSNASRTMLFNIHTLSFDKELLSLLDIPESILPEVCPSSCEFGKTDSKVYGAEIPILSMIGDQQAALFGQTCFEKGEVKNTYGTGGFLLMNTGDTIVSSKNGLLSTIAWGIGSEVTYALEGSVFVCGAVIQWLRDDLKLISDACETEKISQSVPDTCGCYVVPSFTGLGAPYWDPYARGIITGLTRGVKREHIVRAAVESMALQTHEILCAMESDLGTSFPKITVDGGAARNKFLLKFQADISNRIVEKPSCVESTALGAAFLAGLCSGFYKDMDSLKELHSVEDTFTSSMDEERRKLILDGWHNAVKRTFGE